MTTIRPALEASTRAAVAARTAELFRRSGALRDGHFLLKSGRHGDAYVEKFAVLADPAATSELCGFWAAAHRRDDGTPTVDLVAGPTTGGVTELADVLDFLAVGAVAVQVGTAIFADPTLPVRLVDELADACRAAGLGSYRDFIGTALPAKRAAAPSAKGVEYRP